MNGVSVLTVVMSAAISFVFAVFATLITYRISKKYELDREARKRKEDLHNSLLGTGGIPPKDVAEAVRQAKREGKISLHDKRIIIKNFVIFWYVLTTIGISIALSERECVTTSTPPATVIQPTSTETSVPASTAAPTFTPKPTNTPRATPTPKPVAVVVTVRPAGQANPIRITGPIGVDYKSLNIPQTLWFERVAWVADLQVKYGGGAVLLSGGSNGMTPLVVDDVLTIKVLHENGRSDTFEYDFSATSTGTGPQEAGPFDLTQFFRKGVNMLYVTIYDNGYSYWGTPGLWLVEFR